MAKDDAEIEEPHGRGIVSKFGARKTLLLVSTKKNCHWFEVLA